MTIEQAIGTYVLFSMDKSDKTVFSLSRDFMEARRVMEQYGFSDEQVTKLAITALDIGKIQTAKIIQFRNNDNFDGDEPA